MINTFDTADLIAELHADAHEISVIRAMTHANMQMSPERAERVPAFAKRQTGSPTWRIRNILSSERNRIGIAESVLSSHCEHPQPIKLDVFFLLLFFFYFLHSPLTHFALHAKRYKSFVVVGFRCRSAH